MEALGGRNAVPGGEEEEPQHQHQQPALTGEGYEEMPLLGVDMHALDNSASYVMQQDSKVDAMPYNESSIISNEYGQ